MKLTVSVTRDRQYYLITETNKIIACFTDKCFSINSKIINSRYAEYRMDNGEQGWHHYQLHINGRYFYCFCVEPYIISKLQRIYDIICTYAVGKHEFNELTDIIQLQHVLDYKFEYLMANPVTLRDVFGDNESGLSSDDELYTLIRGEAADRFMKLVAERMSSAMPIGNKSSRFCQEISN